LCIVGARPDGRWKYALTVVHILLEPVLTGEIKNERLSQ